MKAKIYQRAKSAMQSGKANKLWILEIVEEKNIRHQDQIMGWTSVDNTNSHLVLEFSSKQEAIDFANKKNCEYEVFEPQKSSVKKKSYASNFC